VFTARRVHRPAILCALASALLMSAMSGAAAARPNQDKQLSAALAQERYYMQRTPETTDAGAACGNQDRQVCAALAQERHYMGSTPETGDAGTPALQAQQRYYSSHGEPEPLIVSQSPAPSDDTPWLAIALSIAAALAIVAASATQLCRLRIRRAELAHHSDARVEMHQLRVRASRRRPRRARFDRLGRRRVR
jgi:hypothetical protein